MIAKMTDKPRPHAESGVTNMPPMFMFTIEKTYTRSIAKGIPSTYADPIWSYKAI